MSDEHSVDDFPEDEALLEKDGQDEEESTPAKLLGRGPLSNETKAQIREWTANGSTVEEIATHLGRGVETVRKIVEAAQSKKSGSKATAKKASKPAKPAPAKKVQKAKTATPATKAPKAPGAAKSAGSAKSEVRESKHEKGGLLHHKFWLRPDVAISFSLPADFAAGEATRLAGMVLSIPFGD